MCIETIELVSVLNACVSVLCVLRPRVVPVQLQAAVALVHPVAENAAGAQLVEYVARCCDRVCPDETQRHALH